MIDCSCDDWRNRTWISGNVSVLWCGMAGAIFMVNYGINPYFAIVIASLLGIVLGAVNGFLLHILK